MYELYSRVNFYVLLIKSKYCNETKLASELFFNEVDC